MNVILLIIVSTAMTPPAGVEGNSAGATWEADEDRSVAVVPYSVDPAANGGERPSPREPASQPMATRAMVLKLIESGRAEEALALVAPSGKRFSDFDRHELTGRACLALQRWSQARDAFEAAVRERPDAAACHYRLGLVHVGAGNDRLALAAYEKADFHGLDTAEFHAAWADALLRRGVLFGDVRTRAFANGRLSPGTVFDNSVVIVRPAAEGEDRFVVAPRVSALFQACRAVQLSPHAAEYAVLAGDVWATAGMPEQAASQYARACPKLPEAQRGACLHRWGECLLKLGDFDGYLARLRERMALPGGLTTSETAEAYARLAAAAAEKGDSARQVRYLTIAVEVEPESVERRLLLGDALAWSGRFAEAAEQWREVLRLRPHHPRAEELKKMLRDLDAAP